MSKFLSEEELRKEPQDDLEQILSDMAFRCAGGITHSGRKEYVAAKEAIIDLINTQKRLYAESEQLEGKQQAWNKIWAEWLKGDDDDFDDFMRQYNKELWPESEN